MTQTMVGPFLLLAAVTLSQTEAAAPASSPAFRPTATVTAHATARILVVSGVKFGADHQDTTADGLRRSVRLTDYDGQVRSAELLEFQ